MVQVGFDDILSPLVLNLCQRLIVFQSRTVHCIGYVRSVAIDSSVMSAESWPLITLHGLLTLPCCFLPSVIVMPQLREDTLLGLALLRCSGCYFSDQTNVLN